MAYKIRVLDETIEEIQEALNWYSDISPDLPADLEHRFYGALNLIATRLQAYPNVKSVFRKYNIGRFPYNIIYKTQRDLITVVAFAHHKRKPNYWKKRK